MSDNSQQQTGAARDLIETVIDAASGLPAPIRKNFIKTFGQLCTAATDIPVAWLEGRADAIRADTRARTRVIEEAGQLAAQELGEYKEFRQRALSRYGKRIIFEQNNVDAIVAGAADLLSGPDEEESDTREEIGTDWLSFFQNHAEIKSDEQMQYLFSKLLAGEIKRPGSYSTKTIEILSTLNHAVAKQFELVANLSIKMDFFGPRLYGLHFGNIGQNVLRSGYGIDFSLIESLQEYRLLQSDVNSYVTPMPLLISGMPFEVGGEKFFCKPISDVELKEQEKFSGVNYTQSGKELFPLIAKTPNYKWFSEVSFFMKKNHLDTFHVFEKIEDEKGGLLRGAKVEPANQEVK